MKTKSRRLEHGQDMASTHQGPHPYQDHWRDRTRPSSKGSCRQSGWIGWRWRLRSRKPMMMKNQLLTVTMTASRRLHGSERPIYSPSCLQTSFWWPQLKLSIFTKSDIMFIVRVHCAMCHDTLHNEHDVTHDKLIKRECLLILQQGCQFLACSSTLFTPVGHTLF